MENYKLICQCGNTGSMACQICEKEYVFHPPFQTLYYCPNCFNKLHVSEQTQADYQLHNKCKTEVNVKFFYSCEKCHSVFCYCIREYNTKYIEEQLSNGVPTDKIKLFR